MLENIQFPGLDDYKKKLAKLTGEIGVDLLQDVALPIVHRAVERQFATEGAYGRRRWKPLKAATLAEKKRRGFSTKPLIRTSELFRQFTQQGRVERIDYTRLKVVFDSLVGAYQQRGTRTIPGREIVPTQSPELRKEVLTAFNEAVDKKIKQTF